MGNGLSVGRIECGIGAIGIRVEVKLKKKIRQM